MTLRARVGAMLGAILVLVGALGAVILALVNTGHRQVYRYTNTTVPAAAATEDLLASVINMETGERGYVITGQTSFLAPYAASESKVHEDIEALRRLLKGDRAGLADVGAAESAIATWQDRAAGPEIDDVRRGDGQAAVAAERTGQGKQLFDAMRARITDLKAHLDSAQSADEQTLKHHIGTVTLLLTSGIALAAALVVTVAVVLRRWVLVPVRSVSAQLRTVVDGDLEHRIEPVGPPEIVGLARDAEAMRHRIVGDLDAARRASEALSQHAPAVGALRRYLIPSGVSGTEHLDVAVRLVEAEGLLAGDWYDLQELTSGRWRLNVVDVSGHGPEAGVLALRTKTFLEAGHALNHTMGDTLVWLAERLGDTGESFLTALNVEVDVAAGTLRYANAGHPLMLLRQAGGPTIELGPTGPLLGPIGGRWTTADHPFDRGAVLVAYTDGLSEARRETGEQFGAEGIMEVLDQNADASAEEIATACIDAAAQFTGRGFQDDVTLIVLRRP
jgi:CHASE3 domain sensor protein